MTEYSGVIQTIEGALGEPLPEDIKRIIAGSLCRVALDAFASSNLIRGHCEEASIRVIEKINEILDEAHHKISEALRKEVS